MPQLERIALTQFKNYDFANFEFTKRVVGICGLNGKGKTNLLDAIYYLCFTKSYFASSDAQNVQFGKDGFRLQGIIDAHSIVCVNRGTAKKEFSLDGVLYNKFSAHIGRFPAVMVAPDDIELVTGSSEGRRKFMDTVLSQTDTNYLQQLIIYNKVLQQRNGLLKRFAEQGKTDWPLLEVMDEQLIQPGNYLHKERTAFTANMIPLVQEVYGNIASNNEAVTLLYESQLNTQGFFSLLNSCREKDFLLQRCNGGVHKDDISIQLNGQVFKTTASQGQRKSMLFALKLAEFEFLRRNKGFAPLLLLDDVFEKLDASRMQQLLQHVCVANHGQVFITDTHQQRLTEAFQALGVSFQLIQL